jgi:DNA-binding SARP family transcriptional activator/DNA-binding XRE family transcriptional regulator
VIDRQPRTLGAVLRAQRIRTGTTQQELADRAGISVRTVRHIEHGHVQHPRTRSLNRLAAVLGLEASPAEPLGIGVLGSLTVRRGRNTVATGAMQQQSVLALLALHVNEVVSQTEIVDVIWGDKPPTTYRDLLHSIVSRLRNALNADSERIISRRRSGYVLQIDPHQVDLHRFDELAARARAYGDLGSFTSALACWRGPVLSDMPERLRQHPSVIAATHRRLDCVLAYADSAVEHHACEQAAPHLQALVHNEPMHEGLHARLMIALAVTGQRSAALVLFSQIRDRLSDELGVEPGEQLRAAHLRVLRGELLPVAPPRSCRSAAGGKASSQLSAPQAALQEINRNHTEQP